MQAGLGAQYYSEFVNFIVLLKPRANVIADQIASIAG